MAHRLPLDEHQKKKEFVNITDLVRQSVEAADIQEGMVLVSAMHITSGVCQ